MAIGRPREFDLDQALDRALEVFWRHGYEGAAMSDLTAAMGINRPSLYAAYGNKESLFRKALERYTEGPARHVNEALEQPTARATAERLLYGTVDTVTAAGRPRGCLVVQGALVTGSASDGVRAAVSAERMATEVRLRERFARAQEEGDLPESVDAAALARLVMVVSQGMAVHAADGVEPADLRRVVEMTMANFPGK
ncbi:TetR/AcrR family transcriptional regulator [Crossiella sp. SN42]|uniref:TetR/AcrR family transcriptional regulator n=1 Tax=Crossiella sp. SN42 TaxID=2944808 RepID=UPI00207CB9F9|nr:TetR/AcrR family transcriptional regulator [Crossiella sp. SN42]MCO1577926.1 TetR/AcrR family transcriptional regulator [Crossiella sp. SN42]